MHRLTPAFVALAFVMTVSGTSVSAQAETGPDAGTSPSPEPPLGTPADAPSMSTTLAFVEPTWRKITPKRGPAGREDHTWTVDGRGRYAYLYGGRDGDREYGDLWRYDLRRDSWKRLKPGGPAPGVRFGHSAVWVDGRGLVVFAGQRGVGFFDDLWVYDPERGRWRELPSRGSVPKARYGSCMAVGPDGRLWISHGFTTSGRFDDTRAYNLKTRRWANLTSAERKPPERCLHDCFRTSAGELVLYGGQDDGAFALGDLWTLDRERDWRRLDDPAPKARRLYAVTEAGEVAYIFGGAGQDNAPLGDLWIVDRATLEFERLRTRGNHPAARSAATLVSDPKRGRLLLFGGLASSAKSDVWELVEGAPRTADSIEPSPGPTAPAPALAPAPSGGPEASPGDGG